MGGGPQHIVHMRGLPFRVTENDICEWFSSVVDPTDISIIYNNQGRPTGEADVMFNSEADANKAMTKDRQNMQHRYIELFYDGAGSGGRGGGGGGYGNGGGGGFGGGRGFGTGANSGNGFSAYQEDEVLSLSRFHSCENPPFHQCIPSPRINSDCLI